MGGGGVADILGVMVNMAALPDQMLVAAFMANLPDHVYFKDRESRFLSVSVSLAAKLGCSVDEVVGKTDFDFFEPALAEAFRAREIEIMTTGEPLVDQVVKHVWADGRVTWSLNVAMPMRDASGAIVGIFGTNKDITAAKLMEEQLEKANRELREMARLAGMAEAATGVVHNVGNVLTSVSVSTNLLSDALHGLKVDSLAKVCALLREQEADLGAFMDGPRGKNVLPFLEALQRDLVTKRAGMLEELTTLEGCVAHIKEIVAIQQSYATMRGMVEDINLEEVVQDALKMSQGAFLRHGVTVRCEFSAVPKITGERGKILQILHNLLRNAKYALDEASGVAEKTITVRIEGVEPDRVRLSVSDNGIGIPAENLTRIFSGFTTRKGGHGFGLHSAANAATEMRGSLHAESQGVGTGACFVLELPVAQAGARGHGDRAVGEALPLHAAMAG